MFSKGRKYEVLIEDYMVTDQRTGVEYKKADEFICWADAGLEEVIRGVEGVVSALTLTKGKYYIHIDHRYDMEIVKREVEAAILCREA